MLCFLILMLFFMGGINEIKAVDLPSYREPSLKMIKNQEEIGNKELNRALHLEKTKAFEKDLNELQKKIASVNGVDSSFPNISEVRIDNQEVDKIFNAAKNQEKDPTAKNNILVFVSLGMPEPLLKDILKQAKKYKAPVYIRGLYKDMKTTLFKVSEIARENDFAIDPTQFERFKIDRVPCYVLVKNEKGKNNDKDEKQYIKVFGDITISSFLEKVLLLGTKEEALQAKQLI